MKNQTIVAMFESNKSELESKLKNLSLPQDAQKVQEIVSGYLNDLLDGEGDFRQNLTQSEDYILQAACSLLNSQQKIIEEMAKHSVRQSGTKITPSSNGVEYKKEQLAYPLAGSAAGGVIGGLLLGTWGAVVGSIAGTAIALYYISSQQSSSKNTLTKAKAIESEDESKPQEKGMNTEVFLTIVQQTCGSIDELIATYRAQIRNVVNKYENMDKPTLEKDYRFLMEGLQSLFGFNRTAKEKDEKFLNKLSDRIENVAELLENYDLTVIDYSEENKSWFEEVVSPNTAQITMVLPAIVKNNDVVFRGKIFVPQK